MKKCIMIFVCIFLLFSFAISSFAIIYPKNSDTNEIENERNLAKRTSISTNNYDTSVPEDVELYVSSVLIPRMEHFGSNRVFVTSNYEIIKTVSIFCDLENMNDACFYRPDNQNGVWLVAFKNANDELVEGWFVYSTKKETTILNNKYSFNGPYSLDSYVTACEIMDTLISQYNGQGEGEFFFLDKYNNGLVYSFGGDQRIIPFDLSRIDESFLNAKSYKQLPTPQDYANNYVEQWQARYELEQQQREEQGLDDDEILYSGPIGVTLKLKDSDIMLSDSNEILTIGATTTKSNNDIIELPIFCIALVVVGSIVALIIYYIKERKMAQLDTDL